MTDLDIGMNQRLCEPFAWDDARRYDRGKVATPRAGGGKDFGRYKDVDGDGIPWRTCRAPPQGASSPRHHARRPMPALLRGAGPTTSTTWSGCCEKFATAATWCRSRTSRASPEDAPARRDLRLDQPGDGRGAGRTGRASASTSTRCGRAFRSRQRCDFIAAHDQVFVVEQNRDAQMRTC